MSVVNWRFLQIFQFHLLFFLCTSCRRHGQGWIIDWSIYPMKLQDISYVSIYHWWVISRVLLETQLYWSWTGQDPSKVSWWCSRASLYSVTVCDEMFGHVLNFLNSQQSVKSSPSLASHSHVNKKGRVFESGIGQVMVLLFTLGSHTYVDTLYWIGCPVVLCRHQSVQYNRQQVSYRGVRGDWWEIEAKIVVYRIPQDWIFVVDITNRSRLATLVGYARSW